MSDQRPIEKVIRETPLAERVNGDWIVFEGKLFNLITSDGPKYEGMYFSTRLRLTMLALRAIREECELMLAERELYGTNRMGILPDPEKGNNHV